MGEINAALGRSGAGHKLVINGTTYPVYPPTQKAYAEFEAWLEKKAREKLRARKQYLSPDEYETEYDLLLKQINSFAFSWGRKLSNEARKSREGGCEWFAILLRQGTENVTAEMVQKFLETDPEQCYNVFLAAMSEGEGVVKNAGTGTGSK